MKNENTKNLNWNTPKGLWLSQNKSSEMIWVELLLVMDCRTVPLS